MTLSPVESGLVLSVAYTYLNRSFDYESFNCVHFVRQVYESAGINLPLLQRQGFPPEKFHLSQIEFDQMPLGHSVFLKRKNRISSRIWTHVAIIVSPSEVIHCTRHFGEMVTITSRNQLLEIYSLAVQPLL